MVVFYDDTKRENVVQMSYGLYKIVSILIKIIKLNKNLSELPIGTKIKLNIKKYVNGYHVIVNRYFTLYS